MNSLTKAIHDALAKEQEAATTRRGEPTTMAKKKTATTTKRATKKTKATAAEKAPRVPRGQAVPIPALDDMRLAPSGIAGSDKNKYITVAFSDGFVVRLLPVNMASTAECLKVRDLMVAWLNKRIGG